MNRAQRRNQKQPEANATTAPAGVRQVNLTRETVGGMSDLDLAQIQADAMVQVDCGQEQVASGRTILAWVRDELIVRQKAKG